VNANWEFGDTRGVDAGSHESAVRWSARTLIAVVLLSVAAVVTDVAWLSPDALGIQDASKVGLGLLVGLLGLVLVQVAR
jgi:hypothetical protein